MAYLIALVLAAGILLAPLPAHADPISTLIVTFLSSVGIPGLTVGGITIGGTLYGAALTTLGSIVAGGITAAIGLGASYVASRFAGSAGRTQVATVKPSDVQGVVRQSLPPRWRHTGRRRVGGALLFSETKGGAFDEIIAFGEGPFDGVEEWICDDRTVVLNTSSVATSPSDLAGYLTIKFQDGSANTAFSDLIARYPSIYDADHKALGVAKAYVKQAPVAAEKFQAAFPNRLAAINGVFRTAKVFDPRDTGQSATNPNTWKYSSCLPLLLADFLTHEYGLQLSWDYIDLDRLSHAADVADELLTTKAGGSVRRYHGGLSYNIAETTPADVITRYCAAMDGRLTLLGNGKLAIDAGEWIEPTVHIADAHVTSFEISDGAGPLREANEVVVKYTFADASWSETSCDPWRDEESISLSGERRTREDEIYEVDNHNHARRLAKLISARTGPRWQGKVVTDLYGMLAWGERFIRLSIKDLAIDAESFEVLSIAIDIASVQVTMEVASMTGAAYAFDPETEEGDGPVAPDVVEDDPVPEPVVTVTTTSVALQDGVSVGALDISWANPGRADLLPQAEYSPANAATWLTAAIASGATSTRVVGLADGASYDVRVRFVTTGGSPTAWVTIEDIPIVADPTAPGIVTSASVVTGSGPSQPLVRWTAPTSANYRYADVFRGTTSTPSAATDIASVYGFAGAAQSFPDGPLLAGTYHYWVAAANGSGVPSAKVYAGSITIS